MAEDRNARPVSGEIMLDAEPLGRERTLAGDVVDAEFETIEPGRDSRPAVAPPVEAVTPRESIGTAAPPMVGMDVLKARETAAEPVLSRKGGPAFWIFGLAIAAGAFWVAGGHALVRQPDALAVTEPAAETSALKIEDITSRVENAGGRIVLLVDGNVVNSGSGPAVLPPLEITVTAGGGAVQRYKLGTGAKELAPAARFSFSSRLEAPRDGVKSVTVDFSETP